MKISLILPYWDRQEAADRALRLLAQTYAGMELEVVVVDDGNPVPFVAPNTDLNMKVVRLAVKHEPKCPSTAWNAGVEAASGEIVILSCVEILHTAPVLLRMAEALQMLGPSGYVLAAAWCPEAGIWHCHSSVKVPRNPAGTGIAFCGALYRQMYRKAGGFDEEYREGAGYEDNDFINRMLRAGARFLIRDDLVVIHPKTGASIEWGATMFARNEALFYAKWPQELRKPTTTFVCVNAGNYCGRGAEYVNNLFDMVRRNLSLDVQGRFACLTDDPSGLHEDIQAIALPPDVRGWWAKLYLFRAGLFPHGERMVFLDLDTLVISSLDEIAAYDGDFATLRDFYVPSRVGPAVMLWRAGFAAEIWDEWQAQGRPEHELGDLWWINQLHGGAFAEKADKLQDLFPNRFVSYKAHATIAPSLGSSIVCFHGSPRPHEVGGWVAEVWRVDGLSTSELKVTNNVNSETIKNNIHDSSLRELPWLELKPQTKRAVLLVGGAPSMAVDIEQIRAKKAEGAYVLALNGAGDFLHERGITPDAVIVVDARDSNAKFVRSRVAAQYFLASQCDANLFSRVGDKTTLFHIDIPDLGAMVPGDRPIQAVGGGITVGLIAMSVAYALGFRAMHLYGYDSSYSEGRHHAYAQIENDDEPVLEAHVVGKTFLCAPWMVTQANQFQDLSKQLLELGCEIHVHGSGLLPTVAWAMAHSG